MILLSCNVEATTVKHTLFEDKLALKFKFKIYLPFDLAFTLLGIYLINPLLEFFFSYLYYTWKKYYCNIWETTKFLTGLLENKI